MSVPSVVIHGHFYQPPREDPVTDEVPRQPSAAPHHDWNRRIHDECYRAVVAARILDGEGRIIRLVNTLAWMSWDAGPTLLRWLEREAPETYRGFLEADAAALRRTGHGGALATPYHHVILPLTSRREKVTEVRWGIADFRRRFRREPEGMWLPEAAVDTETLEVLAEEGIRFTVLAPQQVEQAPPGGRPGRVRLSGGRSMAVFVYDGPLSHDVAFGQVLKDSAVWLRRIREAAEARSLVTVATDGETFGHHHPWSDMALAAVLQAAEEDPGLRLDNLATYLENHPPREDITLVEPSAWSCSHGVDRWRRACGCKLDPSQPTSQAWRSVLRSALAELARALHSRFDSEGGALLRDPWGTRDGYGAVVDAPEDEKRAFVEAQAATPLDEEAVQRVLELLEMERDALRMDTSCAWFFDDIARVEPIQNLRYAAHALDLYGDGAEALERRLVTRLAKAISNDPEEGDGARIWQTHVRGATRDEADETEGESTPDLFDIRTAVARAMAEGGPAAAHLTSVAQRLGIAPDVSVD